MAYLQKDVLVRSDHEVGALSGCDFHGRLRRGCVRNEHDVYGCFGAAGSVGAGPLELHRRVVACGARRLRRSTLCARTSSHTGVS